MSLVAILLVACLALSACSIPSSQSSSSGSESAVSRSDLDSPPPSDIGGYVHEIGDCKFYTETVQTASGMIVPYELVEVFLFTLESFDSGNDFIVGDVKALGLPDYFSIATN